MSPANHYEMFDTELYISKLIAASLQGTISASEQLALSQWLNEDPLHRQHFERAFQDQSLKENLKVFERADRDAIWNKTMNKMDQTVHSFSVPKIRRMYYWMAAVATIVFIGISVYMLQHQLNLTASDPQYSKKNEISPGTSGGTLTLANGKKISLSSIDDGQVTDETGVTITKSADGELIYQLKADANSTSGENTLTTANGQTYQIRLPDGSKVWLNAGSSLTYSPTLLQGGKRLVKLRGEAYFEVVKDKLKPFVVQTSLQETEVLGTLFNINAYANEPMTKTTLLEGSIKVKSLAGEKLVKPGQQATTNGTHIQIAVVDVERIIDWKSGDFNLNHVDFKEAMRKIARWYDVDIIYEDAIPDDMESGGWISRDRPLTQVLKSIESSGMVKFKIDGRKIYVKQPVQRN